MTIKNSLISVAASALLISAMTGCSSSDSTPAATTTTTGIQSSVTAVDGYIYNPTMEAFYLTDDNVTMGSVTLTGTDTTKDTATGVWTIGGASYALADTNTSILSKIKFFRLSGKGSSSTGTTFTPATFIETGASGAGYDTNDTILGTTFVMYAPANGAIMSPVSNLIYLANSAALGTVPVGSSTATKGTISADINSSYLTSLEANATAIAANLGLGDINILTADPVALEATNPTYRLVTALLKGVTAATANSIIGATAPTSATLTNTLATIKTAFTAGAENSALLDDLITRVNAGTFTTADVATMNVEKSVENGAVTNKAAATLTGFFPVNSISVNTTETDQLIATGAKIANDAIALDINMSNVKTDANISNNSFKLLITVKGDKAFEGSTDNNSSTGLVLEVPFEMNSTDGTIGATILSTALCPWEVRASDGSQIVAVADTNATTLNIATDLSVNANNKTLEIDVASMLTKLTVFADANLSSSSVLATDIMDNISNVQILLVDSSSKMIKVDRAGVNQFNFPSATLAGFTGSPSGTGINIVNLSNIDFRETYTKANAAPDNNMTISGIAGVTSTVTTDIGDTNTSDRIVINNNTRFGMQLGTSISDNNEENTTATFTFGTMLTDNNSTYMGRLIKSNSGTDTTLVTNVFDANTTSTTAGELNTTITSVVTDEFGEANTTVMYLTVNRAPINNTRIAADGNLSDGNVSAPILADYDTTTGPISVIVKTLESNGSTGAQRTVSVWPAWTDINITSTTRGKIRMSEDNRSVEINSTFVSDTRDYNITLNIHKATDRYGANLELNATDFNITY